MRTPLLILAGLAASGCAFNRNQITGGPGAPGRPSGRTDVAKIAARVNAQSRPIQSIRCNSVTLDGRAKDPEGNEQIFTLNCLLAFEKPGNFRLAGKLAGRPEVDLGSTDDEIWCWVKRADAGKVFFCKREDLSRVKLAIPFQPDWLAECLGVIEIDPSQYDLDQDRGNFYAIRSRQRTPTGDPVIKRIIFDRSKNDRIHAIQLFDANDARHILASATMEEYYEDKSSYVIPRVVRLQWPETGTEMKVMLQRGSVEFNSITPELSRQVFSRAGLADREPVNMAEARPQQPSRSGYRGGRESAARGEATVRPAAGIELGSPEPLHRNRADRGP
ncbi:MAG TPA: hypothetical protein VNC50_15160 [Planctomycetia bacterium]|nr:hypothetical protein [Planctomycetia bacterium]